MIYNIEQLIHKIRNTPELKKLNNFECFQNVLKTLDNSLSNGIEKIRYKNKVVIIFVKHPIFKFQMINKIDDVKKIFKENSSCEFIYQNLNYIQIKVYFSLKK